MPAGGGQGRQTKTPLRRSLSPTLFLRSSLSSSVTRLPLRPPYDIISTMPFELAQQWGSHQLLATPHEIAMSPPAEYTEKHNYNVLFCGLAYCVCYYLIERRGRKGGKLPAWVFILLYGHTASHVDSER